MTRERLLAETFVELAETLIDDFDVVDVLTRLTARCVEMLEVSAAGIMLEGPDDDLELMASSSEAMRLLELFELQSRQGPCVDCYRTGELVADSDLTTPSGPWPLFAAAAVNAGFRSAVGLPMRVNGRAIGVLNLLSSRPGEMPVDDIHAARALADVASIALIQRAALVESRALNEQLQYALNSRIVIEQAKGVVAERNSVDMEEAFALLRGHARRNNRQIVDVAHDVIRGKVSAGELAPGDRSRRS